MKTTTLEAIQQTNQQQTIDTFYSLFRSGCEAWEEAGRVLVKFCEDTKDAFKLIRQKHPGISLETLHTFARIGRREIYPPLLIDPSPGAKKLLECPYEEQVKYSKEEVEVAVSPFGREIQTVKKKVSELTKSEAVVVFDTGAIRSVEKQQFRIKESRKTPAQVPVTVTHKNVDLGYFQISIDPGGKITCTPCGKSPIAQPVRVMPHGTGHKSAIVLYYRTKEQ